jgi:hypothetical protein
VHQAVGHDGHALSGHALGGRGAERNWLNNAL